MNPETGFANSRLVHFKSSYSNGPNGNVGSFNTIVIIDLYTNQSFSYQRLTQALKQNEQEDHKKEFTGNGRWAIVPEKDGSLNLELTFQDKEKMRYQLTMDRDRVHDLYLDKDKYIRMNLGGAEGKG